MNDVGFFFCRIFRFFERDVNGVREYFRKRFGYECAGFPTFDELERDDNLDIEVACSGFTKQMEKDLLQEYGMESASDGEESNDDDDDDAGESDANDIENNDEDLERLRQQVDAEVKFSEEKFNERDTSKAINFNIQNYIASISQQQKADDIDVFEDASEDVDENRKIDQAATVEATPNISETAANAIEQTADMAGRSSIDGNVSSDSENDDEFADLDPKSREYRYKMIEKVLSDARSQRTYSTSASTIAPSVIKDRIKKTLNVKEKIEQRKRGVVKGEASAVTRVRNENRDTCKEYAGWDF